MNDLHESQDGAGLGQSLNKEASGDDIDSEQAQPTEIQTQTSTPTQESEQIPEQPNSSNTPPTSTATEHQPKSKKRISPIIIMLAIIAISLAISSLLYFLFISQQSPTQPATKRPKPTVIPTPTLSEEVSPEVGSPNMINKDDNIEIILALQNDFETFQQQFEMEPVLGASRFYMYEIQFIGNNKMIIDFEDGHIGGIAVVDYTDMNKFTLIKEYKTILNFSTEEWEEIINKYGQENYLIKNYQFKNNDWQLVNENVFLNLTQTR